MGLSSFLAYYVSAFHRRGFKFKVVIQGSGARLLKEDFLLQVFCSSEVLWNNDFYIFILDIHSAHFFKDSYS